MDDHPDQDALLAQWREDSFQRVATYQLVAGAMRQAARRGLTSITARAADEQQVADVVYNAFVELERQDATAVTSIVGLAKTIAFRRGQDRGRKDNREQRGLRQLLLDPAATAELQYTAADQARAAVDEELTRRAIECLAILTDDQRAVIRDTVMGQESLSDWAHRKGKRHQSASRQRERALEALRRCVESKPTSPPDPKGGNDE
jgi:DNA-directed RNA polymerase specialized sigma24 family protein